jgi:hypothetical protein
VQIEQDSLTDEELSPPSIVTLAASSHLLMVEFNRVTAGLSQARSLDRNG